MDIFNKRLLCKELDGLKHDLVLTHNSYRINNKTKNKDEVQSYFMELDGIMSAMLEVIGETKESYITSTVLDMVELEILNAQFMTRNIYYFRDNIDFKIDIGKTLAGLCSVLDNYKGAVGEKVPKKPFMEIPVELGVTIDVNREVVVYGELPLLLERQKYIELQFNFVLHVIRNCFLTKIEPFKYCLRVDDLSNDFDLKFTHVKRALLQFMEYRLKLDVRNVELMNQAMLVLKLEQLANAEEIKYTLEHEYKAMRFRKAYGVEAEDDN